MVSANPLLNFLQIFKHNYKKSLSLSLCIFLKKKKIIFIKYFSLQTDFILLQIFFRAAIHISKHDMFLF